VTAVAGHAPGVRAVGTTREPAHVHGVHGAAGVTRWKCFAGRRQLASPTEAVEWASLPPGAISGEHLHSRTEEIYLVLSGTGELRLNATAHPVRAGSLVLTGVGNTHGLRNTGAGDLDWLVVECLTPLTRSALAGEKSAPGGAPMSKAVVIDLFEQQAIDTTEVFTGPLRRIEVIEVGARDTVTIGRPDAETAVYVLSGAGACAGEVSLAAGTCVLVPSGQRVPFAATADLRLVAVTLAVPR
jgi:mannose-6-phosphate isomerase-like protein (cupin superfamily)